MLCLLAAPSAACTTTLKLYSCIFLRSSTVDTQYRNTDRRVPDPLGLWLTVCGCYILQGSSANVDAKIRLELAENIRKGMNKRRGPSAAHGLAPAAAKEGGDGGGVGDNTSTSGGEP